MSGRRSGETGSLSKTLLQMKFMQRGSGGAGRGGPKGSPKGATGTAKAEVVVKTEGGPSGPAERKRGRGPRLVRELGPGKLEELLFGRRSFQGANPAVERLMAAEEEERAGPVVDEDADVPAHLVPRPAKAAAKRRRQRQASSDEDDERPAPPDRDATPPPKRFRKPKP